LGESEKGSLIRGKKKKNDACGKENLGGLERQQYRRKEKKVGGGRDFKRTKIQWGVRTSFFSGAMNKGSRKAVEKDLKKKSERNLLLGRVLS